MNGLLINGKNRNFLFKISNSGFTLIEIIIALLIFGVAFVSFYGIQNASLRATMLNRDKLGAMQIAKSILSYIEISEDRIENLNIDSPIDQVSQNLSKGVLNFDTELTKKYKAKLDIGFFKFQGIDNEALRRISLTIYWGTRPEESLNVLYFIPNSINAGN